VIGFIAGRLIINMQNIANRIGLDKVERKLLFDKLLVHATLPNFLLENDFRIPYSTIKKYRNGSLLIPENIFKRICDYANLSQDSFKSKKIFAYNWGLRKGGKRGIKSMYKKYNKDIISEWRKKSAYKSLMIKKRIKKIKIPKENEALGEFIGIALGDGTMTRQFIRVSGDMHTEALYFGKFIPRLVHYLFGIEPSIYFTKNVIHVKINSINLCKYLHEKWGLPYGDKIKNDAKIPKCNKKMTIGCIRGLIDTDGIIGKDGKALCLRFTSHNKILLSQMKSLAKKYGFMSFYYEKEIGTRSKEKISKYFNLIGSSNIKHVIRFRENKKNNNLLYAHDTIRYFNTYSKIKLPYRTGL
jgi:hypothetical protein